MAGAAESVAFVTAAGAPWNRSTVRLVCGAGAHARTDDRLADRCGRLLHPLHRVGVKVLDRMAGYGRTAQRCVVSTEEGSGQWALVTVSHAGAPLRRGGAVLIAYGVRGSAGLQVFPLHVGRSSTQQVNIEVHGRELVRFDDTIAAAIADAVGCGIPCREGYRAVRDTMQCAGYRAWSAPPAAPQVPDRVQRGAAGGVARRARQVWAAESLRRHVAAAAPQWTQHCNGATTQ